MQGIGPRRQTAGQRVVLALAPVDGGVALLPAAVPLLLVMPPEGDVELPIDPLAAMLGVLLVDVLVSPAPVVVVSRFWQAVSEAAARAAITPSWAIRRRFMRKFLVENATVAGRDGPSSPVACRCAPTIVGPDPMRGQLACPCLERRVPRRRERAQCAARSRASRRSELGAFALARSYTPTPRRDTSSPPSQAVNIANVAAPNDST